MKTLMKVLLMKVLLMAAVIATAPVIPAAAQATVAEIIIGNGMGDEILQVVFSPSKEQYARNRNSFGASILVNDKDLVRMELPDHFLNYESFDIEVVSGGKRFVTHNSVKLDFNRGTPVLELSETGKDSTIGFIAGVGTSIATAYVMTHTGAGKRLIIDNLMRVAPNWRIGRLFNLLFPILTGTIGYFTGNNFAPGGLYVEVMYPL